MTPSVPVGEVRLLGDRAFLIGVADAAAARAVAEELTAALGSEAEVVCGAASPMPSRIAGRSRIETRSRSRACSTRWMVVAVTTAGTRSSTSFFCSAGRSFRSFWTSE